jgi:S-DNA-T family DNA segregation ATPase FtsK/SpoIIIE
LGGNTYGNSYDELKPSAGDVKPVVYLKAEIEQEGLKIDQETPPLNFLTDTSVNHYFQGKKDGEKYKGVITKFLKNIDVKANYEKTTIMPLFMEITFEVEDKAMIDEILHHQQEILKELGVELFNITFKNNLINFEIPLANPSKISIKSVLTSLSKINNNQAVIGVDYESAPILLDINRMPRTIIVGKKGSGAAMLLSNIVGSLAYINSPKTLEFIVLSPMGDKSVKHFDALPHLKYPISTDLNECKTRMLEIKNEIEKRYQMFETIGSSNIDEFNKFQKTPTAHLKR